MSALVFLSLCLVFAVSAYFVVRSFVRSRLTFGELMSRVIPAPAHPVKLGTWGEVSDIWDKRKNSAIYTEAADRYRRLISDCTDAYSVTHMNLTYGAFLRNHRELTRSIMAAIVYFCLGKIARGRCSVHMANIARRYANEVLLVEEMAEVFDKSTLVVLEGQFLHGT